MRCRLIACSIVLLAGLGCRSTQPYQNPQPYQKMVETFPSREEVSTLEETEPEPDVFESVPASVETWRLRGPLPDVTGLRPQTPPPGRGS